MAKARAGRPRRGASQTPAVGHGSGARSQPAHVGAPASLAGLSSNGGLGNLAQAGNRAVADLLTVSRQTAVDEADQVDSVEEVEDVETPAPGTEEATAPRLDAAGVTDARRYYTAQPWLYTPAIITQLRTALGLPEGGVDDALVLAVADWQATHGSNDPALVVDGKAGPRTLPRIFRSGLNVAGEGEAFGGEVQTEVIDEWATLATPAARRDRLVELVNQRLADANVPAVTPAADPSPLNAGSFDFPTWRMLIGEQALGGESISEADAKEVADTVYHEARHTEQWFRMAQLRAGQGLTAAGLVAELGIPANIATAARALPLRRGSMEAVIAQGWWDSVYGARRAHRERVLTELEASGTARNQAQAAFDADPSDENRATLEAAQERSQQAFAAYQNLPEENDAWATAPAAAAGVTSGSPEPETSPEPAEGGDAGSDTDVAPAATDEPAGSPPPAGGPAHDVMPEEDLP